MLTQPSAIWRKGLRVLALSIILLSAAPPSDAQEAANTQTVTIEQGAALTAQALRIGRPDVALKLSDALLQARPKDPLIHFMRATAQTQLGQAGPGRRSAARAYRLSDDPGDKFQAAQLAARLALQEERPTLAQIWLRRTAIHAPDDKAKALIARDYKVLRRINPWSFRLRGELRPSSNINNGADTALQVIDGVPVTGRLSGGAQALSGVIGSLDIATSYRLRQSDRSMTSVGGRLYVQRVRFSDEAREMAPEVDNSDYASTYGEVSLRHAFAVGPEGMGGSAAVDVALGTSWWGGERNYDFARVGGERTWRLSDGSRIRAHASAETRFSARYRTNDADILGIGLRYFVPLDNGDSMTATLALRDSDAEHPNGSYRSASLRLAYGLGRPIGPVRVDAGLVLGYTDYPEYLSAGFIRVPGGRQDESIYGDINLFFDRYDYAGFAPMLRLRAGRKSSNDSRFDITEYTVSLGIESKF